MDTASHVPLPQGLFVFLIKSYCVCVKFCNRRIACGYVLPFCLAPSPAVSYRGPVKDRERVKERMADRWQDVMCEGERDIYIYLPYFFSIVY